MVWLKTFAAFAIAGISLYFGFQVGQASRAEDSFSVSKANCGQPFGLDRKFKVEMQLSYGSYELPGNFARTTSEPCLEQRLSDLRILQMAQGQPDRGIASSSK